MIRFLITSLLLLNQLTLVAQKMLYPVPSENPDMLFYLQRSLDMNSVIYEVNYEEGDRAHKKPDPDHPVNIYWLMNDKQRSIKPLTQVQKLGYGVKSEELGNDILQLKLVAYRELPIILKPSQKDNRYHAHISLEGKDVRLAKVFINIEGGTKLKPNVTYIEVTGTENQTGKRFVHRFKP